MNLTPDQQTVLSVFKKHEIVRKFYWTGGTLLSSHYLHHRKSFDLDFFSDTKFSYDELNPFIGDIKRTFSDARLEETKIYDRFEFMLPDRKPQLRFEFVWYNHEKKRLAPLSESDGIMIDSLDDMAANKTMAYFDRNEPKDLLDLYELLKTGKFNVRTLLEMVERKFGPKFAEFLFWSESTKALKRLEELRPYLVVDDPAKQDEYMHDLKFYFLDHGRDFLDRSLE